MKSNLAWLSFAVFPASGQLKWRPVGCWYSGYLQPCRADWQALGRADDHRRTVTVRPVITDRADGAVRHDRQSSAAWYAGHSFDFLVYDTARPTKVDSAVAAATFGPPARTDVVGTYRVLVWAHRVSVSVVGYDPE